MSIKEHLIPALLTFVVVIVALSVYGKFLKKKVEA